MRKSFSNPKLFNLRFWTSHSTAAIERMFSESAASLPAENQPGHISKTFKEDSTKRVEKSLSVHLLQIVGHTGAIWLRKLNHKAKISKEVFFTSKEVKNMRSWDLRNTNLTHHTKPSGREAEAALNILAGGGDIQMTDICLLRSWEGGEREHPLSNYDEWEEKQDRTDEPKPNPDSKDLQIRRGDQELQTPKLHPSR